MFLAVSSYCTCDGIYHVGASVGDDVTVAMISACSDPEDTTHLMHRERQDLTNCR